MYRNIFMQTTVQAEVTIGDTFRRRLRVKYRVHSLHKARVCVWRYILLRSSDAVAAAFPFFWNAEGFAKGLEC